MRGVLFSCAVSRGHNWYAIELNNFTCAHGKQSDHNTSGPVALIDPVGDAGQVYGQGYNWEHVFYIYDPLFFVPVVGGNAFDVPVSAAKYTLDQFPSYAVSKHADGSSFGGVSAVGLCADVSTRLLFSPQPFVAGDPALSGFGFHVNVFQVAP